MKELTKERMRLKINAHKKPETLNPGTIYAVNIIRRALITKIKSPKVNTVIGKVITINNGLTNALISPKTKATTRATKKPDTVTPGNKYATTNIINAEINQFIIIFIYLYYSKFFDNFLL